MKNRGFFSLVLFVLVVVLIVTAWTSSAEPDPEESGGSSASNLSSNTSSSSGWNSDSIGDDTGEVNASYEVTEHDVVIDTDTGEMYVEGILLVYFDPSTSQDAREAVVAQVDGEIVGRMDVFDELQIKVAATERESLDKIIGQLEDSEGVDLVSLDYVTTMEESVTSDPWEYDGLQRDRGSWWPIVVDAPYAWDAYASQDMAAVPVAVLDNGFDFDHEDLSGRLVRVSDNDSTNRDVQSHGTHVAGIIGATAENGKGIAGLNWKGDVLCFDIGYIGSDGENHLSATSIEQGLFDSVRAGAKIINCSFGQSGSFSASEWPNRYELVDKFGRRESRIIGSLLAEGYDFVIVESAGNGDSAHSAIDAIYNLNFCCITLSNCDTTYASADDIIGRVLVVGAVEQSDGNYQLADFSNGGPQVNICAPGSNIYSTLPNNSYGPDSGTSMAAPIVSGVTALTWSANPALSGREVRQIVIDSARETASPYPSAPYGSGTYPFVNAEAAVSAALARRGASIDASDNNEARKAYQQALYEIMRAGTVSNGKATLRPGVTDNGTDEYVHFSVADLDNDGKEELFYSHDTAGENGNSFGCLNDIYEYSPETGVQLQWRCITLFVPERVEVFDSGYIRITSPTVQDGTSFVYMPTDQARADACGLRASTSYNSLTRQEDGWHLLECSAYTVDNDILLTDADYEQWKAFFEGGGQVDCHLHPFDLDSVDAVYTE